MTDNAIFTELRLCPMSEELPDLAPISGENGIIKKVFCGEIKSQGLLAELKDDNVFYKGMKIPKRNTFLENKNIFSQVMRMRMRMMFC